MLKKYKKEISIFLLATAFYFSLGILYSYCLGLYNFWNVLFDVDTPRVLEDLTVFTANHYRATVHPLFVILFQPVCKILGYFFRDNALSCLFIQSVFASISLVSVYSVLKKFNLKNNTIMLLTVLFGTSFGQIVFSSNIETYIFAQGLLALMWVFAAVKMDKELKLLDYIILTLLGVGSLAVTLTNVVQFIIVLFFVVTLNKKNKNRIVLTIIVGMSALTLSVFLACIQNLIWQSAPNFFTKNVTDLITGTSEENLYIEKGFSEKKVLNIVNVLFGYSFYVTNLYLPKTGVYLTFKYSVITNVFSIICTITFIVMNVWYIFKTRLNIMKDKLYYALLVALLFNICLHLFYGNSIAFLYVCHFNFLLILLLGYLVDKLEIKLFNNKIINIFSIGIVIVMSLRGIVMMYLTLLPRFNPVEHLRILPFLIILILLIVAVMFIFDKKIYKLISSLAILLLMFGFYSIINYDKKEDNCDIICEYENEFNIYEKQLKELKNAFMIESYEDTENPIGVYFFGMADRNKMVYKNGKLLDAYTGEVIKEFNFDYEKIIPNMYTVILKDGDNVYRITENENGVYLYTNNQEEELTLGSKINLPEYEDKKYSEVLKVLHQEVLFNIDGSEPKPNIWGYTQAYYRDAMMVVKVLEYSDNTNLILDWVDNLIKVYDNSRASDINEPDNLGELLYIIGATKANNKDLVKKIVKEISVLKDDQNHISGMVDGVIQTYYPTSLAIYGAEKLGIDIDLDYPLVDDAYGKLTWYMEHKVESSLVQTSSFYPYINWGFYHYSGYGKLFILDEIYPLTYEGGNDYLDHKQENECFVSEYYCEKDLYLSHAWTASEMYLMLKDY